MTTEAPPATLAGALPPSAPVRMAVIEEWCIKHALILLDTVQKWRSADPQAPFLKLLVQNHDWINEERWMEQLAQIPKGPVPFPIPDKAAIPDLAITRHAETLRRTLFAVILQESPVLVVGVVDPFTADQVVSFLINYFPAIPYRIVAISPNAYVRLAALAEQGASAALSPTHNEDLIEWCHALGFDDSSYPDTQALVEDLWVGDPSYPPIPPLQYDQCLSPKDLPDALILMRTATHAWVASPRASDHLLHDSLYQKLSRKVIMFSVGPRELQRIREAHTARSLLPGMVVDEAEPLVVRDWQIKNTDPHPEVSLFDKILEAGIRMGASDIHMEPKTDLAVVRFRINGDMITQAPIPKTLYPLLMRRAKIIGGMRHETVGIMQDGAGYFEIRGKRYDMRYSVCVCKGGEEAIVIRIFGSSVPKLEDLGLPVREMTTLHWCLSQESGMFVMTGPTGSGKTTTLYACLKFLDKHDTKIITIEHPVEKHFENAVQVDVRDGEEGDKNTITFRKALRSAMRCDPDVIMVGEMRDTESAQIAVQAALTGHLVLSTVHANDCVGVIERMCGSFEIDRIALGYAMKLSVAQRLVGKLCPLCRRTHPATPEDLRPFPEVDIPEPVISDRVGCPACRGSGHSGRRAILEMLPVDSEIIAMVEQHASPGDIRRHNQNRGYTNLMKQATLLLLRGEISIEEARTFLTRPVA